MTNNKLTENLILSKIKDKKFTVLEDGKTTICNLYLENGFIVWGESVCVDPAKFDKELGERIAEENAKDKIWLLEGYLLQERLYTEKERSEAPDAETKPDFMQRMELEGAELQQKIDKAKKFLSENTTIDDLERSLLETQVNIMKAYSNILRVRINVERSRRQLPTIAQF